MTPDQARRFVAANHRAVMITRRSTGGLQTSPVLVGIDSDGTVVISSRETAYKVRNLRRHPVRLHRQLLRPLDPERRHRRNRAPTQAMDQLLDYYRRIAGEHPDWDDYQRAMVDQRRVLIRLTIDTLGPTHAG